MKIRTVENSCYDRVLGAAGGGLKTKYFQQSASTHSGAGEKVTVNINIVGII